jgi:enamine deaminase RidA (YjgF/YER057c/UK114 family)
VPDEIRAQDWIWSGSEIRNEAEWALEQLSARLAEAGASITDIVNYTLFLTDTGDLYEWDLAWREALGDFAPSRTVIPTKGFALPRAEGAFGHSQGAPRMEAQFRAVVPGARDQRTTVEGPGGGVGHQAAGVKVGSLLWVSAQTAEAETPRDEVAGALAGIAEVCATAGTDLSQLLRVRAIVTEPDLAAVVYSALRSAMRGDPPAVTILVTDRPLPEVDRSVALDAVALA